MPIHQACLALCFKTMICISIHLLKIISRRLGITLSLLHLSQHSPDSNGLIGSGLLPYPSNSSPQMQQIFLSMYLYYAMMNHSLMMLIHSPSSSLMQIFVTSSSADLYMRFDVFWLMPVHANKWLKICSIHLFLLYVLVLQMSINSFSTSALVNVPAQSGLLDIIISFVNIVFLLVCLF